MQEEGMSHAGPKVRIQNLIKIYGDNPQQALRLFREGGNRDEILSRTGNVLGVADVSLDIAEGELFVIMGLSGSGKSTLVRCLNRLIEPTSGHVLIDGEDVAHSSAERLRTIRRTKMSMVFQRFGLFPHMTVAENVGYGLKVQGIGPEERRRRPLPTTPASRAARRSTGPGCATGCPTRSAACASAPTGTGRSRTGCAIPRAAASRRRSPSGADGRSGRR